MAVVSIIDPFSFLERLLYLLEVPGMSEVMKAENHMASASAFVDGGIQEACEDACSICLDEFTASEPSTVTNCKHDFHLQCILEWCQRSSNCPMCWQPISLKDPSSQELLTAVENERNFRTIRSRNATIIHHIPAQVNNPDFEGRIMQHLAAAAAIRRSHIRDGSWTRSSVEEITDDDRSYSNESSSSSDSLVSFSDTLRSRLSSVSMQYRESISRCASGWKELLLSRIIERLDTRDDNRENHYESPSRGSTSTTTTASFR